jgi:hypothetical protein
MYSNNELIFKNFLGGTDVGTQVLALSRQVHYSLEPCPLIGFQTGFCVFAQHS